MRIKIGDLLVKAGVITELQLKAALAEQSQWGGKLGDILVRMEFVTEEVLVRALSKQTGIPRADLTGDADHDALARIAPEVAEEFGVVPIAMQDDRTIVLAMSDPNNVMITDHLQTVTGTRVVARLAGPSAIRAAISRWYRGEELSTTERTDPNARLQIVSNSHASDLPSPRVSGRPSLPPPPVDEVGSGSTQQFASSPVSAQAAAHSRTAQPQPEVEPSGPSASEILRGVEETQRRSVAALKAMVELLIDKGVFSRDEYLARVKR